MLSHFPADGEFEAAYVWPGIAGVQDLAVSEEEKKIFLLEGSKVYQLEIRWESLTEELNMITSF